MNEKSVIRRAGEPRVTLRPLDSLTGRDRRLLIAFVGEVNRRAEKKMELTETLEGSHYAAMTELLKELCG